MIMPVGTWHTAYGLGMIGSGLLIVSWNVQTIALQRQLPDEFRLRRWVRWSPYIGSVVVLLCPVLVLAS